MSPRIGRRSVQVGLQAARGLLHRLRLPQFCRLHRQQVHESLRRVVRLRKERRLFGPRPRSVLQMSRPDYRQSSGELTFLTIVSFQLIKIGIEIRISRFYFFKPPTFLPPVGVRPFGMQLPQRLRSFRRMLQSQMRRSLLSLQRLRPGSGLLSSEPQRGVHVPTWWHR